MSEQLPSETVVAKTDHDRGCQGRTYVCTCGYDEQRELRIAELETQLALYRQGIVDAIVERR